MATILYCTTIIKQLLNFGQEKKDEEEKEGVVPKKKMSTSVTYTWSKDVKYEMDQTTIVCTSAALIHAVQTNNKNMFDFI